MAEEQMLLQRIRCFEDSPWIMRFVEPGCLTYSEATIQVLKSEHVGRYIGAIFHGRARWQPVRPVESSLDLSKIVQPSEVGLCDKLNQIG